MTVYQKKEVLLQASNIQLQYGDAPILRDINFCIKNIVRPGMLQGQVVSLIGRSGIGKTQMLKILAGLQQPSAGSITLFGNRPAQAGDMGVIFQNYYLFYWRTIYQSLLLAARQNPLLKGKEKETVEQYLSNFGLLSVKHYYPGQLSGGQQQRVSIMQQLLKGASFLLLDEPFSGLDVCVLDKVIELLLQVSLSDELKTLIIVSHDIQHAVAISDTVYILGTENGQQGATIKKEIDLIERDLAWHSDIQRQPAFSDTIEEIKHLL
ncbi:ABC transporter ATP-binding protein [Deminuibacter soli]|uniref:ABC transporter ATP-binding protein n=1 Tax=Deminuibacter soli TaxID=2291815 RepID=A0A3E1NRF4_9BACT|nr:ATP-binding cassette domain-containing protein [Deminuibacter soli]RFM30539.1 ABC transporter ATP-binding protein [Deminuibacter soli]